MTRFVRKGNQLKKGIHPGALIFVGEQKMQESHIRLMDYNQEKCEEKTLALIGEIKDYKNDESTTWINVDGLQDIALIEELGEMFNWHNLSLEDILNTGQRPKVEELDNGFLLILKMLHYDEATQEIKTEQVSFLWNESTLLTFQEATGDIFDVIRDRLRKSKGRIRGQKADYLTYALLDVIVDNYMIVMQRVGELIENAEDEIFAQKNPKILEKIHGYKQEILFLRKAIKPVNEAINYLIKSDSDFIEPATKPYLKDLQDHLIQVMEGTETYRSILMDYGQLYHTLMGNKLNDIMTVLTVFSAVFIPLTFIAGVYGTNFDYLPELKYKYSYLIFWIVMVIVASLMITFFRKRKWI